ncbi:hypothetical protein KFK09_006181 [Dendrobium nobile]|uniref:Uncharacterized protein n=1 Tax=Dendrobium nobile TaxID=94219 RepID=A0A8T3BN83_DENNO|nr:hypothetical protein KFK09_006181 [Dendrobium nobile]
MAQMVKVVNSCLVPPALPTPTNPIWLSNLDLFAAPTHVPIVYFFRNSSSDPFPSPAASIKASLARVLVSYYPFAGRFAKSTEGRLEISCTGEGLCSSRLSLISRWMSSESTNLLLTTVACSSRPMG